ncbi:MAG: M28 family peptidase [Bryobacteraceae bacterium]|jgi:Zn-dependent M28 family amino/carboxypeptidase
MRSPLLVLTLAAACAGQMPNVSGERIRAGVKLLSSDLLEGRGPGTRGGQLATEFLATEFALAGAKPAGDNGTYFQKVPLEGVETQPDSELAAVGGGRTVALKYLDDFVGSNERQNAREEFDAEAVFVGFGIVAPEYHWDDFKGADVRGKMLVLFTNEPDSNDPKFFAGRALTYYGRWTYKYEEALRHGALGVVIIHTTPTATYGWNVVRNSWGREQSYVRLEAEEPALAFAGWVTEEAGGRILALAGHTVAELLAAANSRQFRPIPLGFHLRGRLTSKIREEDTRNVVAMVAGSDPELKSEAVIFSAHWDHLGIGPAVNGDSIYNGAVDNGTGCGMLLEMARAWAALEQKPRRSALFIAFTAEEAGLRGSEYYASHPVIPTGKTAAGFNWDAVYPYGRTRDIVVTGAERTTLWPLVQDTARRFNYVIKPEAEPEKGHFYRSDHFSLARAGVPSFSIGEGDDVMGKPAGYGLAMIHDYDEKHYHQPSDEYKDEWDFSGLEQLVRFSLALGVDTANLEGLPTWNKGDEFLAAREKSGVRP